MKILRLFRKPLAIAILLIALGVAIQVAMADEVHIVIGANDVSIDIKLQR